MCALAECTVYWYAYIIKRIIKWYLDVYIYAEIYDNCGRVRILTI